MKNSILECLKTECPFPQVFEDLERGEDGLLNVPRSKIGHIRADYDGYRWWNTVWPCHPALASKEISEEIDRTYDALTSGDALKDLSALTRFCKTHPEACVDRQFRQVYNFYLEGKNCDFWIRFITRKQDYNMYLNAFTKAFRYMSPTRAERTRNMRYKRPALASMGDEYLTHELEAIHSDIHWFKGVYDRQIAKRQSVESLLFSAEKEGALCAAHF